MSILTEAQEVNSTANVVLAGRQLNDSHSVANQVAVTTKSDFCNRSDTSVIHTPGDYTVKNESDIGVSELGIGRAVPANRRAMTMTLRLAAVLKHVSPQSRSYAKTLRQNAGTYAAATFSAHHIVTWGTQRAMSHMHENAAETTQLVESYEPDSHLEATCCRNRLTSIEEHYWLHRPRYDHQAARHCQL